MTDAGARSGWPDVNEGAGSYSMLAGSAERFSLSAISAAMWSAKSSLTLRHQQVTTFPSFTMRFLKSGTDQCQQIRVGPVGRRSTPREVLTPLMRASNFTFPAIPTLRPKVTQSSAGRSQRWPS